MMIIMTMTTSASVNGGIIQDALFWSTTVPSASLVLNLNTCHDAEMRRMLRRRFRRTRRMTLFMITELRRTLVRFRRRMRMMICWSATFCVSSIEPK